MNNNMKVLQKDLNTNDSYVLLNMDFIRVGDYLIFDIYTQSMGQYIIIVEESTILTSILMNKLLQEEHLYISQKDEYKQELTGYSLKYHIRYYQDDYSKILNFLYTINNKIFSIFCSSDDKYIHMENVTLLIKAIIYLIQDNNKYLKNLMPYFKTIDDLATHSIHVAIYAINLGHSLEFSNKKLLKLGIAGLLHDIGTIKIDTAILNKDSSLTQEEIELIQHHPKYSVELLTQNDISDPDILDTVLHHHENNDGTGYPDRLQGKSIRKCSAILSIVNVFNALTSDRAHRKAFRSFEALKIMMQDKKMRNKFNTDYIEHFLRTLQ